MKPNEKEVLDILRKTTLAYLSESDYAQIEKAVEQKGILNLTGTASAIVKSAVQKHEGGGHDQATHGSWAGTGAGGKNIQDMSAKDQKEFIDRMSSAKSGEEQRKIIDEFKGGKKSSSGEYSVKPTSKFPEGTSYHRIDAKTTAGNLDKLFGKGEEMMGDEYERKVTESWVAEFKNKSTGKSFGVEIYDYMRYDEKGLTAEQGQKMPLLSRSESHSFHIGAASKEQAQIVQDYISSNSAMNKAVSVKTGDMVSWNSSGGTAQGKVVRVISSGKINVPDSSFSIEGSEDDPAALIQLYRDGKPTETKVGHKVSTLKKA